MYAFLKHTVDTSRLFGAVQHIEALLNERSHTTLTLKLRATVAVETSYDRDGQKITIVPSFAVHQPLKPATLVPVTLTTRISQQVAYRLANGKVTPAELTTMALDLMHRHSDTIAEDIMYHLRKTNAL